MSPSPPHRIDMHSHFLPPSYQQACRDHGHANPDGMPALPAWSPEAHLDLMRKNNISKSILSISSPGTHLVPNDRRLAAQVSRDCNAYAADLKKKHPNQFGYFASLPLPDVELCLKEIATAAEEGCDGYGVLTNAHGHYLGDPLFDPVFEELNNRHAVLFIHPTTPTCPCSPSALHQGAQPTKAAPLAAHFPNPILEFFFDTARVVTNLFMSGTVSRCPNIKFILPHLGGAFPPLLSRWTGFSSLVEGSWKGCSEAEVKEALNKQIWFDLAGFVFPGQIRAVVEGLGVGHERLVYGSDFPFTIPEGVEMLRGQMDVGVQGLFGEEQVRDVYHRNAERLLGLSKGRV
ncbi:Amidohydrolase [Teratosphaeria destructans]|uniref:6-methylsalicylate decarboxylase n=1 Tax=Teratosphaeria destructans TaxID=418781 RepID=A0A9W7SU26_9PEZI|nr:Amidohydrolase [Teratosphaeria destructans]